MAITDIQGTGELLQQRNQRRAQLLNAAEQAVPQLQRVNASNPIGLISSGLSNLSAGLGGAASRQAEQQNLDRANAIRQEAQEYSRDLDATKTEQAQARLDETARSNQESERLRGLGLKEQQRANQVREQQAAVREARQQQTQDWAAEDRRAAIAGQAAQAEFEKWRGDTERARRSSYAEQGIDSNVINLDNQMRAFQQKQIESGGEYNPIDTWIDTLPSSIKDDPEERAGIADDLQEAISTAKATAKDRGVKWDASDAEFAISQALKGITPEDGWFGTSFDAGDLDEDQIASGILDVLGGIESNRSKLNTKRLLDKNYDGQIAIRQLEAAEKGLRKF